MKTNLYVVTKKDKIIAVQYSKTQENNFENLVDFFKWLKEIKNNLSSPLFSENGYSVFNVEIQQKEKIYQDLSENFFDDNEEETFVETQTVYSDFESNFWNS